MPQVHCGIGFWMTDEMRLAGGFSEILAGRNRPGLLIGFLALVVLLAVFAPNPPRETGSRAGGSPGGAPQTAARLEGIGGLGAKRDAVSLQGAIDLFSSTSWLPPPAPQVASKPIAPVFPFHFVGTLADGKGERQVFLAQHGSGLIVTPKLGDVLAGAFKVEAIGGENLTLLYIPLNEKLTVSFSGMGPEPGTRPAVGVAPGQDSAPATGLAGAAVSGTVAAGSTIVSPLLPPIAGIGVPSAAAGSASTGASGSTAGGLGSSIAGSGTPVGGIGASPASPSVAPTGAALGTTPASSTLLGSQPSPNGPLGTAPANPGGSIMLGIPTAGGPAVK